MVTLALLLGGSTHAQLIDRTQSPNAINEGIAKSLNDQAGPGRGDWFTPGSSSYLISRDPARSIRRGRQEFQRKFTLTQGLGPRVSDGLGDPSLHPAIGAGLSDSCAACHGRPRGSAGFGGDVTTRPDSRDAMHLFSVGLKEMLADEMTTKLRQIQRLSLKLAASKQRPVTAQLKTKGIRFGALTAHPDGTLDTSKVEGVDSDLRVRPFFAHGGKFSLREFIVGALNDEMGLQAVDPDLAIAAEGGHVTTPSGLVLDGTKDSIKGPPAETVTSDPDGDGVAHEITESFVDHLEFYLLNYFKPATYEQTASTQNGRKVFEKLGCAVCHVPDLVINRDRRVADVETVFDPGRGIFNGLFATASLRLTTEDDGSGHPLVKRPQGERFVVRNIFTDLKRHDLGPRFHERNFDGSYQREFLTTPLWGIGSTSPYGHDGRSINLPEVILRHGGEAQESTEHFSQLQGGERRSLLDFLESLVLFPPDDTASNLNPGNSGALGFPQYGHGSIALSVLFNDPSDPE